MGWWLRNLFGDCGECNGKKILEFFVLKILKKNREKFSATQQSLEKNSGNYFERQISLKIISMGDCVCDEFSCGGRIPGFNFRLEN
jgi:hypothetical protein